MVENPFLIRSVDALQVLDSRGDPTVEVIVVTAGGGIGRAIAPAGASKGKYEAVELRDNDPKKYCGRSVLKAVENVRHFLGPAIQGLDSRKQREIDRTLREVDGTKNKSKMGANAMIATSLAVAKAAAETAKLPLFLYLGGAKSRTLPIPMLNIINGGAHAGNELAVQEFLIVPHNFDSFSEALRAAVETYKNLKKYLKEKYGAQAINVGDEGGFAPPMKMTAEAIEALIQAIKMAGYEPGEDIAIALDAAASHFYDEEKNVYRIDGRELTPEALRKYWLELIERYPIVSIEDPFHEEAFQDFALLTKELRGRVLVIGDDIVVTNVERLRKALEMEALTGVIVKPNQIGTLSETLDFVDEAKSRGIYTVISHRSGETEDTTIAHLAVAVSSQFIKTGAPARGERTAKYNELLRIEHRLGDDALYMGTLVKLGNVK
ncbi:MAG: phosphopyruvate hydratase [Crenarchaeota archaeon]|nr:phosphopyruvate hydratase [Thermoproteota archaeon]